MKKVSWSCVVIGMMSIVLSVTGVFFSFDGFRGYNLPFQFLIESLKCGSIAVPKLPFLINILSMPLFDYFLSIILIISGIGTIYTKWWGKFFAYMYAISTIFLSTLGSLVILPGGLILYNEMAKQGPLAEGIAGGGLMAYLFLLLSSLLYPIVLLIFFSRPKVKEKFTVKK